MAGNPVIQVWHQLPQKSSTTYFPLNAAREKAAPVIVVPENGLAGLPGSNECIVSSFAFMSCKANDPARSVGSKVL
jgi:hypothetical protein